MQFVTLNSHVIACRFCLFSYLVYSNSTLEHYINDCCNCFVLEGIQYSYQVIMIFTLYQSALYLKVDFTLHFLKQWSFIYILIVFSYLKKGSVSVSALDLDFFRSHKHYSRSKGLHQLVWFAGMHSTWVHDLQSLNPWHSFWNVSELTFVFVPVIVFEMLLSDLGGAVEMY